MRASQTLSAMIFLAFLSTGFFPFAAAASTKDNGGKKQVSVASGQVDFLATGKPSAIKIHGHGTGLTGTFVVDDKTVSGKFEFPMDNFDTGVEMRNHHMKEKYLETGKFKTAQLEVQPVLFSASVLNAGTSAKDLTFKGTMTLHGVSHPIQGTLQETTEKTKITAHAEFELTISDYAIVIPTYLGITVADTVHVSVDLTADSASATHATDEAKK
jgi:hypothetical protein